MVMIPILAMNRSKELWGEDSFEFKPERWEKPPEAISSIPGVWGHMMTFIGGPRACIGYRFSLVEYVPSSSSPTNATSPDVCSKNESLAFHTRPRI